MVPEVALFLLAGGEGRVESAGIIGPVHIVRCTTVSQYFIARTNFPSPFSLFLSLSIYLSASLFRPSTSLLHPFFLPTLLDPILILSSKKREREPERKKERETERESEGYQTPTSFSSRPFFQHRGQIRARDGFYDLRSVSL